MLAMLLVLMVWSGFAPADRTVWITESVWSVGLLAILLVTRKWFKFSSAAFLGSQGDVWDVQKDILCDTLGAVCAAVAYWVRRGHRNAETA